MTKPNSPFPTHHPLVRNPDGSDSNVRTMTVGIDDRTYVIPSMVGGKQLEEEEAIRLAERQGLHNYPSFATHDKAAQWIEEHHGSQDPQANAPMQMWESRKPGNMSDDSIKQLLGRRVGQSRTAEEQTAIDAARGAIVAGMEDQRIGRLLEAAAEASTPERVEAEAMAARSREHARVGRRPLSRAGARRATSPRNEEGYRRMQSAMENPTDVLQPRPVYEMFPHDPASQPENQDWYRQNTPPTTSTRLSPVQQAQQQRERAALAEEERNMFLDIIESANQRMRQLQRRLEEAQADRPAADRARRNLRRRPEVNLLGD